MDERLKQGYHKIYSELFRIILYMAALSLTIKVIFLQQDSSQAMFEYLILVGTPLYQLVRIRMLNLTPPTETYNTRVFVIRLVAALAATTVIFSLAAYLRKGSLRPLDYAGFLIPFLIIYVLVALAIKQLHKHWARKMEEKYKD